MTETGRIRVLDELHPKEIKGVYYFPIASSRDLNRAYEEARLFRRLGYKAILMVYRYPNDPIHEKHFIVMVARSSLYTSSGG